MGFLHLFFFTLVTRVRNGYIRSMDSLMTNTTKVQLGLPGDLAMVGLVLAVLGASALGCWYSSARANQRDLASPLSTHSLLSPIELVPEQTTAERLAGVLNGLGF